MIIAQIISRSLLLLLCSGLVLVACDTGDTVYTNALPGSIAHLRFVPVDGEVLSFTSYRSDMGLCLGFEHTGGVTSQCGFGHDAADVPLSTEAVTPGGEASVYVAYGLVVDAAEMAVDIEFVNGNTIRTEIDDNGFYLWMAPNRIGDVFEIAELRFLDADGNVLRTDMRP